MKKNKGWQISLGLFFLIFMVLLYFVTYIIIPPLDPHIILLIISLIVFVRLKRQDRIKKFSWIDLLYIAAGIVFFMFAIIFTSVTALKAIPWITLILIGMFADIIGSTIGAIPIFGDFVAGFIIIIGVIVTFPGPLAPFIALTMGIITFIPGPTFGANTLFLILFKLILMLFGG